VIVSVPGYDLSVSETGEGTPVLLVMGAASDGETWPAEFVSALAGSHRVIRYDHRDTGLSTHGFAENPYPLTDLATDAVAVLDALSIPAAHVVGMSMGGTLVQLLLLDHPERLLSASLFSTGVLGGDPSLPGPSAELLAFWEHLGEARSAEEEIAWRVEHWRLLNGGVMPFSAAEFEERERASVARSGLVTGVPAHALADASGLARPLTGITTPTLVIEAPEDPVYPPPNAEVLASSIGASARLVTIPGLAHAIPSAAIGPLSSELLAFCDSVDRAG
jgi:pimeloyl-ACP methyl ester carboxylesterase